MTNNKDFSTIQSQDDAYFQYIRTSIVQHGLKELYNNGISISAFLHRFDSKKRIIIDSSVIGGIEETVDLEAFLKSDKNALFENDNISNNFGFNEFQIWLNTLLSNKDFVSRTIELSIDAHELFLPRNVFDYLMGFKDHV